MASDIVLTVYNNLEVTKPCIESVLSGMRSSDRLIIVDNGSEQQTAQYLSSVKESNPGIAVDILRIDVNKGFIKAANAGMRLARSEYVCLLCNDTIAGAGWIEEMESVLRDNPRIGMVNPMSSTFGLHPGKSESVDVVARLCAAEKGKYTETASCVGFCFLIRKALLEQLGFIDEVFGAGYFEDSDLSRRVIKAGYLCVIARGAYVWHKEHSTFKSAEREELFETNRGIFESRWGRPQRLLYVADKILSSDKGVSEVVESALSQARAGNWIHLVVPKDSAGKVSAVLVHGNVKVFPTARWVFPVTPYLMVLMRRKKPYNRVVFDKKELPDAK